MKRSTALHGSTWLDRIVFALANECRDGRRAIDASAAVEEHRLRKAAEGLGSLEHLMLCGSLVILARNAFHAKTSRRVVAEKTLRMEIYTAADVVSIKLCQFKQRDHGLKARAHHALDPGLHERPRGRWKWATTLELRMIPQRTLRARELIWQDPYPQFRFIAGVNLLSKPP